MKSITKLFTLFLLLFPNLSNAAQFVEGMEDVPLAPNMHQITQDDVYFGNEETRLLEAYFSVKGSTFNDISQFYQKSLPQLGWQYQGNRGDDLLFYREGENFELIKEDANPLIIRITIKTKP